MNHYFNSVLLVAISSVTVCIAASAQQPGSGPGISGVPGIESLRDKAENGDARAQVALGNVLVAHRYSLDALAWYRKAAAQTNLDAVYYLGHLLLYGAAGIPREQSVRPDPVQGLPWIFQAATNGRAGALRDMSRAFLEGRGVATNSVAAYAWLQLYSEKVPGGARFDLNRLALKMDASAVQQGQALAARFEQKQWPKNATQAFPPEQQAVQIDGGASNATPSLIIDGKRLAPGESTRIDMHNGTYSTIQYHYLGTNSAGKK